MIGTPHTGGNAESEYLETDSTRCFHLALFGTYRRPQAYQAAEMYRNELSWNSQDCH